MYPPQSQIISRFGFFRFIGFAMHLNIYMSRCIVKGTNVEIPKRPIIWEGGSKKLKEHQHRHFVNPQVKLTNTTTSDTLFSNFLA
jgi:hypothetical protein